MTSVSTDRRLGVNSGAALKVPCRAASTGNLTLSGEQTIDGVACVTGDRVLVKNQTSGAQNGIYIVDTGTWGRAPDWDGAYDVVTGTAVYITSGSSNSGTYWAVTTTGTITVGTTSVAFTNAVISSAASISTIQSGIGPLATAATRAVSAKLSEVQLSATDASGIDLTGTNDCATVINNILSDNTSSSGSSGQGYGVKRILKLTKGKYRLSSSIAISAYTVLDCSEAILLPDSGIDAITGVTYSCDIIRPTIVGGRHGITIATGNTDGTVINIIEPVIINQTGDGIKDDAASNSTLLNIVRPKFYNTNTSARSVAVTVDKCNIVAPWLQTQHDVSFQNGDGTHSLSSMTVTQGLGVPITNAGSVWFKNYGSLSLLQDCRWGGESARQLVQNEAAADTVSTYTPTSVVIDDCAVYASSIYAVKLNAIPNVFIITRCRGLDSCKGIDISTSITDAVVDTISPHLYTWRVRDNQVDERLGGLPVRNHAKAATALSLLNLDEIDFRSEVATADKTKEITLGGGGSTQSRTTTSTFPSNTYGETIAQEAWTGDDQTFSWSFASGLTGFATGVYTFVLEFNVTTTNLADIALTAAGKKRIFKLPTGKYMLAHPFLYISGTSGDAVTVASANGLNGQTVQYGNFKIFAGVTRQNQPNVIVLGTAAPGSGNWEVGAIVKQSTPVAAGTMGLVCVTRGAPGTWKTWGAIAA